MVAKLATLAGDDDSDAGAGYGAMEHMIMPPLVEAV